jgi:hypothetical protein
MKVFTCSSTVLSVTILLPLNVITSDFSGDIFISERSVVMYKVCNALCESSSESHRVQCCTLYCVIIHRS